MSDIPTVKVLEAINPINSGTGEEQLHYHDLRSIVDNYRLTNSARWDEVLESEPGSLEELSGARQLASEYLLRTAEGVIESSEENRDLWADRYTKATIELYGEPDSQEAARLLLTEYELLNQLKGNDTVSQPLVNFLLETYKPIIEGANIGEGDEQKEDTEAESIHQYGQAVIKKYGPLFEIVDRSEKSEFSPSDLEQLFNEVLEWMKENDDPDWNQWRVVITQGTSFSIDATDLKINIASRRESATLQDTRGLIAHEFLVHALRAKNGYKTGNKELGIGLPGFLDAEEGLGILSEEAVNEELPAKAYDRYIDIALALGSIDGVERTRREIFQINFARQVIRSQIKGTFREEDLPSIERRVWGLIVDRIYRGGPGDNLGTKQAIFTKDIAYYVGYKLMARFIKHELDSGKSADEVFQYLSQARFDPTNVQHTKELEEVTA